ncbi:hypothetical protein SLEP1_g34406 [Rubroshorea leprosula]|uniref:NAD-dependent epimerase/dehydratase domain-containing protein n=1 Tax=Rubroshorea leprosula TaxID=152421 RepID=A0AAV5KJZ3_9ROSI|nr:hypothetical protein SLEP1_g34406 [Rubroshorea leprosula]
MSTEQSSSQVSPHLQPSSPFLAAIDLLHIYCWSCYKYAAEAVTDLLLELLSKLLAAACRSAPVPNSPLLAALHCAGLSSACYIALCRTPSACCTVPDSPHQFSQHQESVVHVLVMGGAGYIGSHAALRLLKDSYRVMIVDNLSLHCTVPDSPLLAALHCAGLPSVPDNLFWVDFCLYLEQVYCFILD